MIPDPAAASSDCIALAVEFFREPSRFPDLLHGRRRLPHGVTALLQLAAGSSLHDPAGMVSGAGSDESRQAVRFFIEQVLLAHHASHYRVLGVDPVAPWEDIKEHHRLLMRLFHPDRQTIPDARTDAFATRINQAYTVLRNPDTRAAYDLTLADKRKGMAALPNHRNRPQPLESPGLRMPTFVVRHLPQFALGGITLMAVLGVTLVYLYRVPTDAIHASKSTFAPLRENAEPRVTPTDLPPAIARALAEPGPADLPPTVVSAEAPPALPVDEGREHESAAIPGTLKLASTRPAAPRTPAMPTRAAESASPVAAEKTGERAQEATAMPVAVNAPTAPEIKPQSLRPDQLNGLIASLAEQYQRGDLENLLELFDTSARSERGDKKQIRAEYGELFRNSENRALHIWDVAWSGDGRTARGEGSFQARVLRKGDRSPRIYSGAVTIEVVQRNDRPLIVGLYQKTEN